MTTITPEFLLAKNRALFGNARMEDNPVSEVAETVAETVDTAVPDPVTATAEHPVSDDVPPKWAEKLIDQVEDIADKVSGETEHHETPPETERHDAAEHEHHEHDESPVSKPWTHRNPFSRGD